MGTCRRPSYSVGSHGDSFRRIGAEDDERDRHSFHLFDGDVVEMFDDCQDVYQHAVLAPEDATTNQGARVSLVFKNALLLPSGKKGHGLPGSGTRSDRKKAKIRVA